MFPVWLMTLSVICYGAATGLVCVAIPQACLKAGIGSSELGIIGAVQPLGYAIACLAFGRIFRNIPGKYVVIGGIVVGAGSMLWMAFAQEVSEFAIAQTLFGIAGGAFWPFTSAWMLDFESPDIVKTRILRFYNVGWTSGTGAGAYVGGLLSENVSPAASFYAAAGVMALNLLAVLPIAATRNTLEEIPDTPETRATILRVRFSVFVAAVLANLCVLGTRTIESVNFPELNLFVGGNAERMGRFMAGGLVGQLAAFLCGRLYEPLLGMRRLYVFIGVSLIVINLSFAFCSESDWVLMPAVLLLGFTAAVAFQKGILAATQHFRTVRTGTTVHEMVIGIGGLSPLAAGVLIDVCRKGGSEELFALRSPFIAMSMLCVLALAVQLLLVTRRKNERALLAGK